MSRQAMPALSTSAQAAFVQYQSYLQTDQDIRAVSLRNYLSDLRQFMAWCEQSWGEGQELEACPSYSPAAITTPLLTRYRSYLQSELQLKPASVNRYLISLKKYCGWASEAGLMNRNVAKVVKLVDVQNAAPRHLTDSEEEALVAAVEAVGNLRDRTIIVLMLHTGLRAGEICHLKVADVTNDKRSGSLKVVGKGNKYREVPLNVTSRKVLREYLAKLEPDSLYLFNSGKTGQALTARGLGYLVKKYAELAKIADLSPHDLRHRFGYRMAQKVPLHRLAQLMGHDSLDTTMLYIKATKRDLQQEVEKIAWE